MFRQVVLNLLSTVTAGSVRASIDIVASGQESGNGNNLAIEIKNKRNEYSKDQCLQIEDLCLEEELVRILEAGQHNDVNLIIALILSRQLGWPIDFVNDDVTCSFVLMVPVSAFAASSMLPAADTTDGLINTTTAVSHPPLRKPADITIDQMHKDAANVAPPPAPEPPAESEQNVAPAAVEEQTPIAPTPPAPKPVAVTYPECLLVSCSDLVPLFEKGLGFKCDESFLEESAINSVARAIRKKTPYRFIFVDLDDPTLLLGRFMTSINRLLEESQNIQIDVYATASTSSERMLKKCKEVKVKFIAKPMTTEKVQHLV